jgi:uncharacterized protein YegJ (DUF2314 family)
MKAVLRLLGLILPMLISYSSNAQAKIESGKLTESQIWFEYGIYYTPDKQLNKEQVVAIIKAQYPEIAILDSVTMPMEIKGSGVFIQEINEQDEDFSLPSMEMLEYFGQGLDERQKDILQTSKQLILIDFFCEEAVLVPTMTSANELIIKLLSGPNDIIFDPETREYFTKDYWEETRLIANNSINIMNQITMHLYANGDFCRVITLGMLKFGLPDICIENISCYSNENVAYLINLIAQTMHEKNQIEKTGKLNIDINALANKELKARFLDAIQQNAQKKATINIVEGVWEDGDPLNRIVEIAFPKQNTQIYQEALLEKVFGSKDEVVSVSPDDELLAASERAKAKIPELYKRFSNGLPEGTHLLIKFPFDTPDGDREWMWVEVIRWEGKMVEGILQNIPKIVKNLRSGQEVRKPIDEMFDYIIQHNDGTQEGNETTAIILKQRK